ncbi:hypothetical protein BSPLISOX_3072 [uncultured Gammaproteobacteria bacterium]|nr:hypothetical protein [uncultured Gammaproteobacteria bacterium]VVH65625.1 hypothetical protein BSPLISOX_3072 [uncultured Gammaproteobacteria bacterium]
MKRTAENVDTSHHKATHCELLKQNKQLEKDLKLSQMEVEILKKAQALKGLATFKSGVNL